MDLRRRKSPSAKPTTVNGDAVQEDQAAAVVAEAEAMGEELVIMTGEVITVEAEAAEVDGAADGAVGVGDPAVLGIDKLVLFLPCRAIAVLLFSCKYVQVQCPRIVPGSPDRASNSQLVSIN